MLKILIRYLKEKNMFHVFKAYIDNEVLTSIYKNKIIMYHNLLSSIGSTISNIYDNKLKNENLNFFYNLSNQLEFHSLIFEKCKPAIDEFISNKTYKVNFYNNLLDEKKIFLIKYGLNNDYNNISSAYFNYLMDYGISPFNVFSIAFQWDLSKEGYKFWHNIDMEYRIFLWDFLNKK